MDSLFSVENYANPPAAVRVVLELKKKYLRMKPKKNGDKKFF